MALALNLAGVIVVTLVGTLLLFDFYHNNYEASKMGKKITHSLVSALLGMAISLCALAESNAWPDGAKAAVSLSYDDALHSQLDHAIPALNKYDLRASFYLTLSAPVVRERLEEWRAAAAAGHELGNHTLFHPCSKTPPGRDWVAAHNDLDNYTLAQINQELDTANSFLKAIDGRDQRTLTPPCIDSRVSDGNYIKATRDKFVAIKGFEQGLPEGFSSMMMPSGSNGEELIAFVKAATEQGGMANIIFHGVGGDHLAVSTEAHEALLKYLDENRATYWTDSYINIMKHLNAQ